MAQVPVPYCYRGEVFSVYPMRLRDNLEMDMWLQQTAAREYAEQADLMTPDEKEEFSASLGSIISGITCSAGGGREFLWSSPTALTHYVFLLTRKVVGEDKLSDLFFPKGMSDDAVIAIGEMEKSVICTIPEQPKLKVADRKPRYASTPEEDDARIYHFLATKFHWSYDHILDLTEYQIAWYCHLFPEEREHYEDMDMITQRRRMETMQHNDSTTVNQPPGTIHFSSPEAYEQWKASRMEKKST